MERFLNTPSLEIVEISTTLRVSNDSQRDALHDRLIAIEKKWPKRPVDLLGGEATDDRLALTHLFLSVENRLGEVSKIELELNYSQHPITTRIPARRRRKLQNEDASVKSTLSILEEFCEESHWHCTCHWTFNSNIVSTVIQLPLLRIPVPGTRMTEISGVRFTDPLKSEHVILDLISTDSIHMAAYFAIQQSFSTDMINIVVARGEEIREAFISPREGKEE